MIRFESVSKAYGKGTQAIRDFSLLVPSSRTLTLVGSSGSGKTTLLRLVNRMVDPTSGRVLIDEEDIRRRDPVALRRSIGYVLQNGGLLPHRTVAENIATVPVLNGVPRRRARQNALGLLERVGMDASLADRYPHELSGGQQQRVGVARALASDPNILLMDEPFGAVDPIVRRELQDELLRLQKTLGKTILFVTHDIDEALRLGDAVVVLREGGVIAQQGTPQEILSNPANEFVREFVGVDRADRQLSTAVVDGPEIVLDADGRPVGVMAR
ncbi:ABC transporter ATP-binding protein [Bifidobacterium crudilactis]|uniref:ABC transporter ATP-binding protein n=1 Tax=Bifidobacterium crudilactis TaxID=327277 RepID=UPI002648F84C|nr:ATP-binding cassette domain-containing protein [Bifidobacterium crudilactis]MDN6830961.1 ATP-binding cassette domain-containing protein [Bifidobacterium crudilactis]